MKTNLSLKDELLSAIRRIVAKFWAQEVGQLMRLQSVGYHAKLRTKIGIRSRIASRMLLSTLLMLTVCIGNAWGAGGDEIKSASNIESGKWYYIKGVRTQGGSSGTVEYLSFSDAVGKNNAGTGVSSTADATPLLFTYESSKWYMTTPKGFYVNPGSSNAELLVTSTKTEVQLSTSEGFIVIQNAAGTRYLQKNPSMAQFGGYGGTMNNVTLIEETTYSVNWSVDGGAASGTPSTTVTAGNKVSTLPTTPDISCGDKVFVGWSATPIVGSTDTRPSDLFTYANAAPAVTGNVTYYAVFAIEENKSTLLSENFSSITTGNNTSTSGSSTSWSYNSNFSSSSSVYQAGGAVKVGGDKSTGYLLTKELTATVGSVLNISFKVKGWTSIETNIAIQPNNSEFTTPASVSYGNTMSGSFESRAVSVVLTSANPKVKIGTVGGRAFLDDISITSANYSSYATSCCTPPATELSITSANTVAMGNTITLTSADGNGNTVTWDVEAGTGSGTISAGVFTPTSAGTVTIKAQQDMNTIAAIDYCPQDVEQEVTITVNVSSVSVDPTSKGIIPGETFTITPTVLPAEATDQSVSWTSSATGKATVNANGVVTGVAAGSATITCTTTNGSKTADCAVTIYGVSLAATDDSGDALPGVGPGSPTRDGINISPAANAGGYVFKEWQISGASLGSSATTKNNTITSPTGAVTVTAIYYSRKSVTWLVDGEEWTAGNPSTAVDGGTQYKDLTYPTDPTTENGCGDRFVGWTTEDMGAALNQSAPGVLLTTDNRGSNTTAITTDVVFRAVFADYDD